MRVLPQFDPKTHSFHGWISADPVACRIELLTRTLAEFGSKESAPSVAALGDHEDHFVRWNSIRHLLRLDGESGIKHVRAAIHDRHPDVRQAAVETLALIESSHRTGQEG